jgi:phage tail protein X
MGIETLNGRRVWRCGQNDMADEVALAVYGATAGAAEAIIQANDELVAVRGVRFDAGDVLVLPTITPPSKQRRRLFE